MKKFYRVCGIETKQGLWYSADGEFTGLIHDKFSFCLNTGLKMVYDPDLVGYMSAVESLDDLYKWFTIEDILKLQEHNFFIHMYLSDDFKHYDRFNHPVISQTNSILSSRITLSA